jgi:hypothetical protein
MDENPRSGALLFLYGGLYENAQFWAKTAQRNATLCKSENG